MGIHGVSTYGHGIHGVSTYGVHAPVVSTVHGGVAHGLTTYSHGVATHVAPVHTVAAPVVRTVAHSVATPVVSSYAHSVATPLVNSVYGGVYSHGLGGVYGRGLGHYYGKREAEPYTIGQVYAGLPYANAFATGHPHNVGYTTGYPGFGYGYPFYG